MNQLKHEPWTFETASEESKKYNTMSDFVHGSQGCYKASKRNGWLEEFIWLDCTRKKKKEKYPYEMCKYAARRCKTLKEFVVRYPRLYKKACNRKWIKDFDWLTRQISAGETAVENMLKVNYIGYTKQQTFPWLKSKRNLKLDFYLPDYKVGLEIQGLQHFNNDDFFCDDGTFIRDREKYDLCAKHGIRVMYFADKSTVLNRVKDKYLTDDVYGDVSSLLLGILREEESYI